VSGRLLSSINCGPSERENDIMSPLRLSRMRELSGFQILKDRRQSNMILTTPVCRPAVKILLPGAQDVWNIDVFWEHPGMEKGKVTFTAMCWYCVQSRHILKVVGHGICLGAYRSDNYPVCRSCHWYADTAMCPALINAKQVPHRISHRTNFDPTTGDIESLAHLPDLRI
jgi:hypothetical protein